MGKLEPGAQKCPICGRVFFPTGEWIYKTTRHGKQLIYCRWTCYREGLKKNEIARKIEHNQRIMKRAEMMA